MVTVPTPGSTLGTSRSSRWRSTGEIARAQGWWWRGSRASRKAPDCAQQQSPRCCLCLLPSPVRLPHARVLAWPVGCTAALVCELSCCVSLLYPSRLLLTQLSARAGRRASGGRSGSAIGAHRAPAPLEAARFPTCPRACGSSPMLTCTSNAQRSIRVPRMERK